MDWIGKFLLVLLIKLVYPASVSPPVLPKNEEFSTRSYQVTENIIDIPDNRTLSHIIRNFTLVTPLNFGNNTIAANNNVENNNNEDNNNEESSEKNNNDNLKKHSFSILHIKAEYDDKPVESKPHQNVLSKVFGGVKEYVYHLKKGVVDGLHSFFHKNDDDKPEKNPGFHDKFHRNFDGVEDFGEHDYYSSDDDNDDDDNDDDDNDDDDETDHFGHY